MTAPVELNTNINTNNNALNMPKFGTNSNMQSKPKSIFDMQPSVNNYDNDFMVAGVNFATNSLGTPQGVNGSGVNFATNSLTTPPIADGAGVNFATNGLGTPQGVNGSGVNFATNNLGTLQGANATVNNPGTSQGLIGVESNNVAAQVPNFNGNANEETRKISANEKTNEPSKDVISNKYRNAATLIGFLAPIATEAMNLFKGKSFARAFNWKQLAITSPLVALAGFGIGAFIDSCLRANKAKEAVQG